MRMRTGGWIGATLLALGGCNGGQPDPAADAARLADPATVTRTGRPNDFLLCPPNTCKAMADAVSKTYDVSADRLAQAFLATVSTMEDARLLAADPATRTFAFEQLSKVFRFADTILVRFIEVSADRSTLVLYSRSELGYWDIGVNRRRSEYWLDQLDNAVTVMR